LSNISIIGAGYVGLVSAVGFAELGHKVNLLEIATAKLNALEHDEMPIMEPGLAELWKRHHAEGRISLTNNPIRGLLGAKFVFIDVGTPSARSGKPDLRALRGAVRSIAETASGPLIVVVKSTVPAGTAHLVSEILARHGRNGYSFPVVSNPEFQREGAAVFDFFHPSRIVVGSTDTAAAEAVAGLYQSIEAPLIFCDNRTAEMSKYVSNVFLATRISFINEMALLCDEYDVDIVKIAKIMEMDPRFGSGYLNAGLGWGGSCLPKDVKGLIHMAKKSGVHLRLTRAVQQINDNQPFVIVRKLNRILGSLEGTTIGVLGLSFKPGSDDMRETRSLLVISHLLNQGCQVKACDPAVAEKAAKLLPGVNCCSNPYELARGCDALVLVTEWDEFKKLDLARLSDLMKQPIIIDGRNVFDPEKMREAGFIYEGIGRGKFGQKELEKYSTIKLENSREPALSGDSL
jgi:UDPglucose 6-dehydrogenase